MGFYDRFKIRNFVGTLVTSDSVVFWFKQTFNGKERLGKGKNERTCSTFSEYVYITLRDQHF